MADTFRSRLIANDTLLGTMLTLTSPAAAEVLAEAGFDWLFVDAEHGPFEWRDILAVLQAVSAKTSCVVRVPSADEVPIKKTLDLGAQGIIVPQVNTAAEANDVVRFAKYAPDGARGVGLARAHGYGMKFEEYVQSANERVAVVVQAETADAVDNIESIVQVAGVDAVLIGPYDLSASLGVAGRLDAKPVTEAINHITETCLRAEKPLGMFGVSAAAVQPYIDRGFTLIIAGVDTLLLGRAAKNLLDELRR